MSRKTHEISEEKLQEHLEALGQVEPPRPGNFAREQALERALAEFDAVSGETEKSSGPTKGMAAGKRPMSIINRIKGLVPMNARFPVAATLSGLLLLPLGVFLFQNTALTPVVTLPGLAPKPVQQESMEVDEAAGGAATKQESDAPADTSSPSVPAPVVEPSVESAPPAPQPAVPSVVQAPSVVQMRKTAGAPLGGLVAPMQDSYSVSTESGALDATTPSGDRFAAFEESPVKSVRTDPVSTFSIDVDTASYAYVRRALNEGRLPEPDAVRIEEMVNYFSYDYARPDSLESPFLPQIEISPSPWNNATQIMRIGIKGYVPPADERRPVNLVFLVDTSGSMSTPDKLPLLKRALALVVDQMHDTDTISIVAYAGSAGTVLEPTPASDRAAILGALERLESGGSTAGAQGIELAYRLAEQNNVEGSVSRVLLATDGDFNVGLSSDAELKQFIERKREGGTFLSVLGFGTGNLNDSLMQTLAQNGNGTAYYIDSFREARKVLVEEIGATLTTIAKDVKIQIEFNPALVAEYRLIGYETRALNREDFNNDAVDAGDIGAGHTVTALYELTPADAGSRLIDPLRYGNSVTVDGGEVSGEASDEIGFFKLRYKAPDGEVSRLISQPVTRDMVRGQLSAASDDTRFAIAVAAFGQKLRHSVHGTGMTYAQIRELAAGARGADELGYRAEFLQLVDMAATLSGEK